MPTTTRVPSKGRYDRSASASERAQQAREAILRGLEVLLLQVNSSALSVDTVTQQAGVGRNTFYSHFGTLQKAVDVATEECLANVGEELEVLVRFERSTAPLASIKEFADGFCGVVSRHAKEVSICQRQVPKQFEARLLELVHRVHQLGARSGVFRPRLERTRAIAAAGAMRALAQSLADGEDLVESADALMAALLGLCR